MTPSGQRAAFLDRDGIINVDSGYVGHRKDFVFIDGVQASLARLARADYLLVIVTNQSGIARGYYTEADFWALTDHMCKELAAGGAPIARVFHCPHLPSNQCDCRKPAAGMILAAAKELSIDLARSIMIGDKPSDMAAGRAAGVRHCFLVDVDQDNCSPLADGQFVDLAACVRYVLA